METNDYDGPCTGIFGRSYEIVSYLCNPWKNKDGEIQEARIINAYKNRNGEKLKVADIGCGGCADHILWKRTIEETLKEYGIENPEIEIVGLDINEEMFEDILHGKFDYTEKIDDLHGDSKENLYEILNECFEKKDDLFSYEMKKEYTKELNLVLGDAYNLNFEDDSFDIVTSNFLLYHLDEYFENKNRKKVFNELTRIVKKGGLIFTEAGFFEKKGYYKVEEINELPYIKMDGELEPIRKTFYDYRLGENCHVYISHNLCDVSSFGSEYVSNEPLIEEILELIEDGDKIAFIGTGNNEMYPRNLSERLKEKNIDYKKIKVIDPKFHGKIVDRDKNIEMCPKTYQEELGFEGESSSVTDLVNNAMKDKARVVGLKICKHQLDKISEIEEKFRNNGYTVNKPYDDVIIANISDKKSYEKNIVNIKDDCEDYWKGRFFEG